MIIKIVIVAFAALVGFTTRFYMKTDNPIEEQCEQVIEDQTGYDIDLSPDTPEED